MFGRKKNKPGHSTPFANRDEYYQWREKNLAPSPRGPDPPDSELSLDEAYEPLPYDPVELNE